MKLPNMLIIGPNVHKITSLFLLLRLGRDDFPSRIAWVPLCLRMNGVADVAQLPCSSLQVQVVLALHDEQDLQSSVVPVMGNQPSWRLGYERNNCGRKQARDELQQRRQSPRPGAVDVLAAVIHDGGGQENTKRIGLEL